MRYRAEIRRMRREVEAVANPPCHGPMMRILEEGVDFPMGGDPPERGPCEICGVTHESYDDTPRTMIVSRCHYADEERERQFNSDLYDKDGRPRRWLPGHEPVGESGR